MDAIFAEAEAIIAMAGWVSYPLLLLSGLLWISIGRRYVILRVPSGVFRKNWQTYLANDASSHPHILSRAYAAILALKEGRPHQLGKTDLELAIVPFARETKKYCGLLKAIVVSAPLMGLLGTVIGMIETFDSLAEMSLYTDSGGIAQGTGQALITTQMGLMIAVPGLLFDRYLRRKEAHIQVIFEKMKDTFTEERSS